nr:MAG: hypothetical protein 2 [Leviviridae sp.]
MTAQANVTLNGVVFNPAGVSGGVARWVARGSGIPNGFQQLSLSLTQPSSTGKVFRINRKLVVPVVQAVDSVCACAGTLLYTDSSDETYLMYVGSTTADRLDLYNKVGETYHAAGVPDASGPFYDAFVNLVLPTG